MIGRDNDTGYVNFLEDKTEGIGGQVGYFVRIYVIISRGYQEGRA